MQNEKEDNKHLFSRGAAGIKEVNACKLLSTGPCIKYVLKMSAIAIIASLYLHIAEEGGEGM